MNADAVNMLEVAMMEDLNPDSFPIEFPSELPPLEKSIGKKVVTKLIGETSALTCITVLCSH